jgi:hypothetical protein
MIPTLSSVRPSHLMPFWRICSNGALLIACVFIGAATTHANAEYTFTLIADSTGPFKDLDGSSLSLNSTGTVAFRTTLDSGNRGVFSGNGMTTTTIAISSLPFAGFGYPSINQAGTVAFVSFPHSGFADGIYAGNGGPLTTIASTAGPFSSFAFGYTTSINTAGTVAFWAALDTGPGGIFLNSGDTLTPVSFNSLVGVDFDFSMNEASTFAFRSGNGARVLTANGGTVTTIADSSGPLNYFGSTPSLNNAGTVAFVAGVGGIDGGTFGIYKGNGGALTTIADLSGPYSYLGDFNFYQPSINDSGTVAFFAGLDAGGYGIFLGDGADTRKVIGTGDAPTAWPMVRLASPSPIPSPNQPRIGI